MVATNYLRTVLELARRGSQRVPTHFRAVAKRAKAAPKFSLPQGGRLYDSDLRDLITPVRLPYPTVVLEFPVHEYPLRSLLLEIPEDKRGDSLDDDKGRDRVVIIAEQQGDDPITVTLVQRILGSDSWIWLPFTVAIASTREISEENPTGLWMAVNARYPSASEEPLSDGWMAKVAGSMMKVALYAVYDMVHALNQKSRVTNIPARKLNKTAKRAGAVPFDAYKVLTIEVSNEAEAEPTLPTGDSVDRSACREHERRGHWRVYKSGLRRWIEKQTINKGIGGKVIKDYAIK